MTTRVRTGFIPEFKCNAEPHRAINRGQQGHIAFNALIRHHRQNLIHNQAQKHLGRGGVQGYRTNPLYNWIDRTT
ncbi:MAG: hypothetical protein ACFFB5_06200 [Promethearchaeota archaeon]